MAPLWQKLDSLGIRPGAEVETPSGDPRIWTPVALDDGDTDDDEGA
jgi:hypothetical protein